MSAQRLRKHRAVQAVFLPIIVIVIVSAPVISLEDLSLQVLDLQVHDDLDGRANVLDDLEPVGLPRQLPLLLLQVLLVYLVKLYTRGRVESVTVV
jgi:hypothetical protein